MMQEDQDDDKPAVDENAGPKILMGRIGKKKKTKPSGPKGNEGGPAAADLGYRAPAKSSMMDEDTRGNEGFTDQDIEFMR